MATNIVQMKDGSGNNQYPVTSAEAVGMPDGSGNLQTYLNKRVTELNISVLYPTNGEGGTNKYDLATAIAQVPSEYRTIVGLKITFINNATSKTETWKYDGGTFTTTTNWTQGSGSGGNKILEWNTDVATTRMQIISQERKVGMQISYKNPASGWVNEQFIGLNTLDAEWIKDSNWSQIPNVVQMNLLNQYKLLDWDTDKSTTRLQVETQYRKPGMIIFYQHPTEGYITEQFLYNDTRDVYWRIDDYWQEIITNPVIDELKESINKNIYIGGIDENPPKVRTAYKKIDENGYIVDTEESIITTAFIVGKRKGYNDQVSFKNVTNTNSHFVFHDINNTPIEVNGSYRQLIEKDVYYQIPNNAYYLYSESFEVNDFRFSLNKALEYSADYAQKNTYKIEFDFADPSISIRYLTVKKIFLSYSITGFVDKITVWCSSDFSVDILKVKRRVYENGKYFALPIEYIGSFTAEVEGKNDIIFKDTFFNDDTICFIVKAGAIGYAQASGTGRTDGSPAQLNNIAAEGFGDGVLYELYMRDNIDSWKNLPNILNQKIVRMNMPIYEENAGRLSDKMYFLGNWHISESSVTTKCSSQSAYAKISNSSFVTIKWSQGVIGYKINDGDYIISEDAGGTQKTLNIEGLDKTLNNFIEIKAIKNDYSVTIDDIAVEEGGSVTPVKPKRRTIHFLGDSIIQGNSLTSAGLESFAYLLSNVLNCNIVTYAESGYRVYYDGVRSYLMKKDDENYKYEKADIFVMALATNGVGGSGDFNTEYTSILNYIKSEFPGTPLICLVPQNNAYRESIEFMAEQNKCYCINAGWFGYANHPNAEESKYVAEYLYNEFIKMFGIDYFNPLKA